MTNILRITFLMSGVLMFNAGFSQKDSTKKRVEITSAFKPSLKESAKINFNASPAPNDTSKAKLNYDIPNQNLLFAYQPGNLKPLALDIDSGGKWDLNSFIKAGFGSLKTPYVQAGFSFGDGKTAGLNIFAKHVSSSGKKDFQDFRNTDVGLKAFFQTEKNMEWNAKLGMNQERYYKYGFQPETLVFPKDSLKQNFQTWTGGVSVHNINRTEFGISYSPEILINIFNDDRKNSESNTFVNLPLEKEVGEDFAVKLGVAFDLTRYKPEKYGAQNNTFYYLSPSVVYRSSNFKVDAGIRPSWDNKTFKMFPNVLAEVSTNDNRLTFQVGWTGYIRRTSYQYLASINPWLNEPTGLKNTWVEERYAGFKGTAGDHFTFSTKVGYHKLTNQPLFLNDMIDGKSFDVVYEPSMRIIHFGGEIGYTVQEKFSFISGVTVNKYFDIKQFDKAYGLIPIDIKAAMRVQVMKDLWIKSDVFAWTGPKYLKKDGSNGTLGGAFDLNAGVEFRITKNFNLWAQFNNILNKEYQRWDQYPSYGFNFVGGVIFAFNTPHP